MTGETSFASVQRNFSQGISLGGSFMDEDTYNHLSSGAKEMILELSKISIEYMNTAIETAMQGDTNFPYEWKELAIKNIQEENKENEILDQKQETITLQYL